MPATYTLTSTSLASDARRDDSIVSVASTSGLTTGIRLFVDDELMNVVGLVPDGVRVLRGVDGTRAAHHDSGSVVWVGSADKFYTVDPQGDPREVVLVSPHINIRTGAVWFAKGDTAPNGKVYRWWQKQAPVFSQGALGGRTMTLDPTSSD